MSLCSASPRALPRSHSRRFPETSLADSLICFRVVQEPNRNRKPEPETGTVRTVFPGTEEEPEPSEPFFRNRSRKTPLPQRNRRSQKPEPPEPFQSQTVTELNRTGATLFFAQRISRTCLASIFHHTVAMQSIDLHRVVQNTKKYEKITRQKKIQIPHSGFAPNIRKKYRKITRTARK